MLKNLLIFSTFLVALMQGTLMYSLGSVGAKIVNGIVFMAFVIRIFQQSNDFGFPKIDRRKVAVALLYLCFLLANYFRDDLNGRGEIAAVYFLFVRGFLFFIFTGFVYQPVRNSRVFSILPPLSIFILGLSVVLEIYGIKYFHGREQALGSLSFDEVVVSRPGGWLNANAMAALSLVWLFVTVETSVTKNFLLKVISVTCCLVLCLVTQSRGAVLFLAFYGIYKIFYMNSQGSKSFFALIIAVGALFFYLSREYPLLLDIVEKLHERGLDDNSAQDRYRFIGIAYDAFLRAPLLGNGMRYLFLKEGFVVHNEILEWLSNFGLAGLLMLLVLYFTFYHRNSFPYLCLCIFPMFVFSSNFFETVAFQIALSFAYYSIASDAHQKARRN